MKHKNLSFIKMIYNNPASFLGFQETSEYFHCSLLGRLASAALIVHSDTTFKSSNLKLLMRVRSFKKQGGKDFLQPQMSHQAKKKKNLPISQGQWALTSRLSLSVFKMTVQVVATLFAFIPKGSQQENWWVSHRLKMCRFKLNAALTLQSSINNWHLASDRVS